MRVLVHDLGVKAVRWPGLWTVSESGVKLFSDGFGRCLECTARLYGMAVRCYEEIDVLISD